MDAFLFSSLFLVLSCLLCQSTLEGIRVEALGSTQEVYLCARCCERPQGPKVLCVISPSLQCTWSGKMCVCMGGGGKTEKQLYMSRLVSSVNNSPQTPGKFRNTVYIIPIEGSLSWVLIAPLQDCLGARKAGMFQNMQRCAYRKLETIREKSGEVKGLVLDLKSTQRNAQQHNEATRIVFKYCSWGYLRRREKVLSFHYT